MTMPHEVSRDLIFNPFFQCCYITVGSGTTALHNGACTYRYISKQIHYKTPFSHNGYIKSLETYENYICSVWKKTNFLAVLY